MRRRGVVYLLTISGFVLTLGLLATASNNHRSRPVAAPAANPVEAHSRGTRGLPRDDARPPANEPTQSVQPRPPADLPHLPVSFIRRPRAAGAVALTIDDGPHPVWTPEVLDLLAQYHVHATFCMIGEQVQKYSDLVRRIVSQGNTLCDHTWDHDEKLPSRTPEVIHQEIQSTYDAIVQASGGVRPVYYRAPGGNWGDGQVAAEARRLGLVSLNWSVDPVDWSRPGTQRIISTVLDDTGPGDVILMHDGGGNRQESLDALRVILPMLLARGDTFVTP